MSAKTQLSIDIREAKRRLDVINQQVDEGNFGIAANRLGALSKDLAFMAAEAERLQMNADAEVFARDAQSLDLDLEDQEITPSPFDDPFYSLDA